MLIISSWLSFAPSALLYFYLPQVHFYTFIHNTQSLGLQDKLSKKVRDVSKGGGGSPEERPHDVSPRQNRYVTLPLASF